MAKSVNVQPCGGVIDLLDALSSEKNILKGLLTGSLERVAPIKLRAATIDPAHFSLGAYGSDAEDRNELPIIAIERAARILNEEIAPESVLIIGDTPKDIECAHFCKTKALAVASGVYDCDTLSKHSPDYLVEDLTDTQKVLDIIIS